jgi:hypothetical protein
MTWHGQSLRAHISRTELFTLEFPVREKGERGSKMGLPRRDKMEMHK